MKRTATSLGRQQNRRVNRPRSRATNAFPRRTWRLFTLLILALGSGQVILAQVVPAGDAGRLRISCGGTASAYDISYGAQHLLGYTAFADADAARAVGLEAEVRRLEFHQKNSVHAETYSMGLRYHRDRDLVQPYGKVLAGFGHINFPYNYATGRYAVLTLGGGIDYGGKRRLGLRTEFEYQRWPGFSFGALSSYGLSTGIRVRIF